ncbi:hypothetical protein [Rhizobium etli]|uniref:hypothetical protein n=1 Tax=Rhizobium etli TaxID=29449 RepID=UPI001FD27178|nr:hypothetical protein [Rhizobium etli]
MCVRTHQTNNQERLFAGGLAGWRAGGLAGWRAGGLAEVELGKMASGKAKVDAAKQSQTGWSSITPRPTPSW